VLKKIKTEKRKRKLKKWYIQKKKKCGWLSYNLWPNGVAGHPYLVSQPNMGKKGCLKPQFG